MGNQKSWWDADKGGAIGGIVGLASIFLSFVPWDSWGEWTLGMSMVFALITTSMGMLYDIQRDLRRKSAAKDRATRLMMALESSDLDEDPLVVLCESAGKIRHMDVGGFVKREIQSEIREFSSQLDGLADDGRLRLVDERKLVDYINGFTRGVVRRMDATSAIDGVDEELWSSGGGRDYLALQKERLNEGVRIRRIFFSASEQLSAAVVAGVRQQEDVGVEVGVLLGDVRQVEDFIAFDDRAVVLTTLSSSGHGVAGGLVMFREDEIARYASRYDQWWSRATRTWGEVKIGVSSES